jgi:hypothetical protein
MATKAHSYLFLYIGAFVLMLFLVITASNTMEYFTEQEIQASNKLVVESRAVKRNEATPPSIFNPNKKVVRQILNANKKNKRERVKPLPDEFVLKPEKTLDTAQPTTKPTTVFTNTKLPVQTYFGPSGTYESIGSDGKITIKPISKGLVSPDSFGINI